MADNNFTFAKLKGDYQVWKFRMRQFLTKENLWFVIRDEKLLEDNALAVWSVKDEHATAWIGLLIDDSQINLVKNAKSAKEAWEALRSYHEKATLSNKIQTMRRICNMKLADDGDIELHINEMTNLFEKLRSLDEKLSDG